MIPTEVKCPFCGKLLFQTETVRFIELICQNCGFIYQNPNAPLPKEIEERINNALEEINYNPSRRKQLV